MPNYPERFPKPLIDLRNETEKLVSLGLNHSAIVLSSILLEATLKELLNKKTGEETSKMRFNSAIDKSKSLGLISEKEFKWLKNVNSLVRNNYIHFNVSQIANFLKLEGRGVPPDLAKKELDKLLVPQLFRDVDEFVYEKLLNLK